MTALAHRGDPQTSHDAAERVNFLQARHHAIILATLKQAPKGLTAHQIADRSNLEMVQVNRRLHELAKQNAIQRTGERRKTPSGRTACVWSIPVRHQFRFEGME